MPVCYACGNDYDKSFQVTLHDGETYHFDSVECAAVVVAPTCATCGVRILGHGLESDDGFYCCDHCARKAGVEVLRDRV